MFGLALVALASLVYDTDIPLKNYRCLGNNTYGYMCSNQELNFNVSASAQLDYNDFVFLAFLYKNFTVVDLRAEVHFFVNGRSVSGCPKSLCENVTMENIMSEEHLITSLGHNYVRFNVDDHDVPDEKELNKIINFIKTHNHSTWLHVHCHGGKGRTTLFLAIYDVLMNRNLTYEEIIDRQSRNNNYDLLNKGQHRVDVIKHVWEKSRE